MLRNPVKRDERLHEPNILVGQLFGNIIDFALADDTTGEVAPMGSVLLLVIALHHDNLVVFGETTNEADDAGGIVPLIDKISDKDHLIGGLEIESVKQTLQLLSHSVNVANEDRPHVLLPPTRCACGCFSSVIALGWGIPFVGTAAKITSCC